MNTAKILQIESFSSDETLHIAGIIGKRLKGYEVIECVGDLGAGKTTFVRGLVAGSGSTDKVASPTFSISRRYNHPQYEIHHYDFYRLQEAGVASNELRESLEDDRVVTVVEWANIVQRVIPLERLKITLQLTGEQSRRIRFDYPETYNYLFEGLGKA